MTTLTPLLERLTAVLERVEQRLPPPPPLPDWERVTAWRWRTRDGRGWLQPVPRPHPIQFSDLRGIEHQCQTLDTNTRQFVRGLPANNALLWGSRGTGKSSLVKALLQRYADQGLRLIEVDKQQLTDLPDIVEQIDGRPERFMLFCDDLSFEANESGYKALKAVLDGSIAAPPDNVMIIATSNRRHLLPEFLSENLEARNVDGEIHHGEAVEEKISLSERFGLWLSFHPFSQEAYLDIVHHWLGRLGAEFDPARVRPEALRWALAHGSRSGRSASQFARDWVGRAGL